MLVISSDLPEILALSDRILVIRKGVWRASCRAARAPKACCSWPLPASIGRTKLRRCRNDDVARSSAAVDAAGEDRVARTANRPRARVKHLRAAGRGHARRFASGAALPLRRKHPQHLSRDRAARSSLPSARRWCSSGATSTCPSARRWASPRWSRGSCSRPMSGSRRFSSSPSPLPWGQWWALRTGCSISYLRVPSIVLTLGMLYLLSGVTYIVAHGNQVNPYNVPSGFVSLSITSPIDGIPGS